MTTNLPKTSIRAASWIGAQCVSTFCATHGIEDKRINAFVNYVEAALSAQDVLLWESYGTSLEVTGLGDPLPSSLAEFPLLSELIDSVREITASQMYGAWEPIIVAEFLETSLEITGFENDITRWSDVAGHNAEKDGWGQPMFVSEWLIELDKHGYNVLVDELVFHLQHGASVESVRKISDQNRIGVLFQLFGNCDSFLDMPSDQLEAIWNQSQEITSRFTQLSDLVYRN